MQPSRVFDYPEQDAVSRYVFSILDVVTPTQTRDGFLSLGDLRIVFQSMHLNPGPGVLAQILKEAGSGRMSYEKFRLLRIDRTKCELNVLAEFKKFDIDQELKGLLTKKNFRKMLTFEGFETEEMEAIACDYMNLDKNRDGYISYKDLYDYVLGPLTVPWQVWLSTK